MRRRRRANQLLTNFDGSRRTQAHQADDDHRIEAGSVAFDNTAEDRFAPCGPPRRHYGSEGWGFDSLRAHHHKCRSEGVRGSSNHPRGTRIGLVARGPSTQTRAGNIKVSGDLRGGVSHAAERARPRVDGTLVGVVWASEHPPRSDSRRLRLDVRPTWGKLKEPSRGRFRFGAIKCR